MSGILQAVRRMSFGSPGGSGDPATGAYLGISNYVSGSNSHAIAVSYGGASASRSIIHGIHYIAGVNVAASLTACAIGGVNGTVLKTTVRQESGQNTVGVIWVGANLPTGASGNLAVSFSHTVGVKASTFRCLNLNSLSPEDDADVAWGSDSSNKSISIDVSAGGLLLAGATTVQSVNPAIASGVTQAYSGAMSGNYRSAGGIADYETGEIGQSVNLNRNGGGNWRGAFSAIALR